MSVAVTNITQNARTSPRKFDDLTATGNPDSEQKKKELAEIWITGHKVSKAKQNILQNNVTKALNTLNTTKEMLLEANILTRQLMDGFLPEDQVKDLIWI